MVGIRRYASHRRGACPLSSAGQYAGERTALPRPLSEQSGGDYGTSGRKVAARESGKRPGKLEEKYRKRVEELLYGELSAALGISRETVPQYIRGMLKEEKSGAGKAEAAS